MAGRLDGVALTLGTYALIATPASPGGTGQPTAVRLVITQSMLTTG